MRFKIGVFLFCLCLLAYSDVIYLKRFSFDENEALKRWKKMILNGEVEYVLVRYGDDYYVRALSDEACSALYYRVGYNLKEYPFLSWRWKALQFPNKSQAKTEEEKDDYAARVYVIFPFLSFSSSKFLEYVWSEDEPLETIIDSPAGSNVKIIVARNGKLTDDEWVSESRNVYEDYARVFGKEPRRSVGAIAIMCDADSTRTQAESLFDEISIASQVK